MTKHLSSSNLSALDTFWQRWPTEAGTPKQRRIRLRLYMVYLLIRHGGLRLSEALNVNDNRDLVFSTSTIHVARDRDVQVEEQAMNRMLSIVEDSALTEYHGTITHIDPGYVHKNFYQASEACGLEKELGGPRVLRHTRGIELLERGIPVSLVQKYLGLASPLQAIRLKELGESEAREIMHAHLRREALRHSSTRNAFAGEITDITESKNMSSITLTSVSGLQITALISEESMRGYSQGSLGRSLSRKYPDQLPEQSPGDCPFHQKRRSGMQCPSQTHGRHGYGCAHDYGLHAEAGSRGGHKMHGQLLGHVGRHLSRVDAAGSEQTTAQKKPPEEYLPEALSFIKG